jgi:hypothetical protein|tara:strand:- start:67 stop:420 length:354 start_codon:yes stop_codon:yes gene_type:complete
MPFKSEKQRKWMWANEPEMAKKWEEEEEEQNETLNLNPNVNVPGMGDVSLPGDPGTMNQFADQEVGSGDIAFPLPDEDEDDEEEKKKKKKKRKKLLRDIAPKKLKFIKEYKEYVNSK